jgi:hypothetical protein
VIIEVVAIVKRAESGVVLNISLVFSPFVQPDLEVEVICQQMDEGRKLKECSGPGKGKFDKTAMVSGELGVQNIEINSVNDNHKESGQIFCNGQKAGLGRCGNENINF